jgi:hypothetical protein
VVRVVRPWTASSVSNVDEEQPEHDPAGDGPRRFASSQPFFGGGGAEAALTAFFWPGRAERRASVAGCGFCGHRDVRG